MVRLRSLAVVMFSLFAMGCATADTRTAQPDTPKQATVRRDLEACNASTGGKGYRLSVTADGRYSFVADGDVSAQAILDCMKGKRYSARLVDFPAAHGPRAQRPTGGEGE